MIRTRHENLTRKAQEIEGPNRKTPGFHRACPWSLASLPVVFSEKSRRITPAWKASQTLIELPTCVPDLKFDPVVDLQVRLSPKRRTRGPGASRNLSASRKATALGRPEAFLVAAALIRSPRCLRETRRPFAFGHQSQSRIRRRIQARSQLSMRSTSRILSLVVIVAVACTFRSARAEPATTARPNILFIYADDQSYKTVGCYPEASPG